VQLPAPGIPEILANAGFDFCIVDLEHGAIDLETAENMIRAANAAGIACIVRVTSNREELIGKSLDFGADGVHVPQVSTVEQAESAVRASKFFPLGHRGVCPMVRAAKYSADRSVYYDRSNRETMVILAIESVDGIRNLPEIMRVKGVDAVFVGPYDLSQSLGITGQVTHPEVVEKIREISALCRQANLGLGTFVDSPEAARQWVQHGIVYCCVDVDAAIMFKACKTYMNQLREGHT